MRIGIFGDSWGSYRLDEPLTKRGLGWPEILSNTYNVEIINHSVPGTSFYYSYKLFLEHWFDCDYNIFLITKPGRINVDFEQYDLPRFPGYFSIERKKHHNKTQLEIADAVDYYFKYLMNIDYDRDAQHALLDQLKSITNNTIFIPCFDDSTKESDFSLIDFYQYEQTKLGFIERFLGDDGNNNVVVTDLRVCHMNEENNIMFADKIYNALKNNDMNLKFKHEDFVISPRGLDHIVGDVVQGRKLYGNY